MVEEFHGAARRQCQATHGVLTSSARLVLLGRIHARHQKLDAQRVAVERPWADGIGKGLEQVGAILTAQLRRLALALGHVVSSSNLCTAAYKVTCCL